MSPKPLETKIPTIMQYIKKNVPKGGLLDKSLQPNMKKAKKIELRY